MAKLTDRTELTLPADGDLYVTTDVSDTTDAATGTDKKITWANLKAGFKTYFDTLYAGVLGADDNYVTDAEKISIGTIDSKAPLASPTFTGTVTLPKTTEINDTTGDHQYVLAVSELSADRTVTLPLLTGADEFVFKDHSQTLTNKTLTTPKIADDGYIADTNGNEQLSFLISSGSAANYLTIANADAGGSPYIVSNGSDAAVDLYLTTKGAGNVKTNRPLVPYVNDSAALGTTALQWSDLFLAEGGVINWDNGDATLTQVGDVVTLAGADLKVSSPGNVSTSVVTTDATQTLTNKTLTSPTLTTPSAFTTGGTITLAENTSIALDPAGSADGKYSGITVTGTAGATLAFGDLCYLDPTDSRWELADANAVAAADGDARGILGICVLAAGADGNATTMLLHGIVRADTAFPALTIGAPVYVSETAGDIVVTQPTTTDVVIRIVGVALTADEIFFNPDFTWTTHT